MHAILFFAAAAAVAGACVGIVWAIAWYWRAMRGIAALVGPRVLCDDPNLRDDSGMLDIRRRK